MVQYFVSGALSEAPAKRAKNHLNSCRHGFVGKDDDETLPVHLVVACSRLRGKSRPRQLPLVRKSSRLLAHDREDFEEPDVEFRV